MNLRNKRWLLLVCILMLPILLFAQSLEEAKNYVSISAEDTKEGIVKKAADVRPSERQFAWQELEFTAFFHFGINTFTDVEWGNGDEDPALFNPTAFDARQWLKVCKDAGIKLVVLTAKHHDGFCLWPSKYTDHSVASSPWLDGKGDVVREVANACREFGIKFGVYLSPWDRHEPSYGDSPKYNQFFRDQLRELLTEYGPVDEVWFDGANGEGPNGKQQIYDWPPVYQLIRELQPQAVIAIMGPDVRWVGNEIGYGRETEWSVLPVSEQEQESIAANSQQAAGNSVFVPAGDRMKKDLGSRAQILNAKALAWYPSEVDVSIRPGWFYHASQDYRVKSPEKLVDIFYSSIGRNSVLLLNLPPDKRGLIHENDVASLMEMRRAIDATFAVNFAENASVATSSVAPSFAGKNILDDDKTTFWMAATTDEAADLMIEMLAMISFDRVMLQENIRVGQRVEKFVLEAWRENEWETFASGTTIGYKRLLRFPPVTAKKVRIRILESRTNPTLQAFGLYKAPPKIEIQPEGSAFVNSQIVEIKSDDPGAIIRFTTDGRTPDSSSLIYNKPMEVKRTTTLKAAAFRKDGVRSFIKSTTFNKALHGITLKSNYSPKYTGGGALGLIDSVRGSADFTDGRWQGYEGEDFEAIIDLGEVKSIQKVSAGFLQDENSWIFLPQYVRFSVSENGDQFVALGEVENEVPANKPGAILKAFYKKAGKNIKARYLKVFAKSLGICPEWHKGAGGKAWIFIDEILIKSID